MEKKYQIKSDDFLAFDALRQCAQCIGRVIRNKQGIYFIFIL